MGWNTNKANQTKLKCWCIGVLIVLMAFPNDLLQQFGGAQEAPLKLFGGVSQVAGTPFDSEINQAADTAGIDPTLLAALAFKESTFNPNAVSGVGAQGLTQLMPPTARSLGVQNSFDPLQNLTGGAQFLKQQIDQFGSVPLALAAFNAGPGNVRKFGGVPPFQETQNHVNQIMKLITGQPFDSSSLVSSQ